MLHKTVYLLSLQMIIFIVTNKYILNQKANWFPEYAKTEERLIEIMVDRSLRRVQCGHRNIVIVNVFRTVKTESCLLPSLTFSNHISSLTRSSYFHLRCLRAIATLFRPLSLPPAFTHLYVLEFIIATLYSLSSLKFDYLLCRPSAMLRLDSLFVFSVSLTSSLLQHNNFLTSPPTSNSKLFYWF